MTTISEDNILCGGIVEHSETASYRSLGHYILSRIKEQGDAVMMIDATTGTEYKASYLYERIIRMIYCLEHLNIKQGDVVGLSAENSIDFLIIMYATYCLNAIFAPLNVTYTERELDHAVNLSKPKIFFASKSIEEKISRVAKKNKFIQHVFVFADTNVVKGVIPFRQLTENLKISSGNDYQPKAIKKTDTVALIVCSSGTTGLPKGVQLTHQNILSSIDRQFDPDAFRIAGVSVLSVIPWFHAFGCLTLVVSSCIGTTMVFLPKFEEHLFLGSIEKYQVMVAFMVPPLMVFLAKHPIIDKYDLSSLLVLICGAAPLSRETEDAIKERIGVPSIRQGYGLSEGTLSLLVQTESNCKPGSVGVLKRGLYAKIIDTETGKNLGANQRGELCFKGDCIMKGYIGDRKSTQSLIRNGWLHTGDVGYFDDDFEFFIVDRIKELIKYKGFQVPPAELEAILLTNPKIKDAAVIGKPDEASGELPFAFVVKQANVDLTEKEVIDYVADRASAAKKLRGGVRFIDEIPKNPSGKILRRVLRDMLKKPKSKL